MAPHHRRGTRQFPVVSMSEAKCPLVYLTWNRKQIYNTALRLSSSNYSSAFTTTQANSSRSLRTDEETNSVGDVLS